MMIGVKDDMQRTNESGRVGALHRFFHHIFKRLVKKPKRKWFISSEFYDSSKQKITFAVPTGAIISTLCQDGYCHRANNPKYKWHGKPLIHQQGIDSYQCFICGATTRTDEAEKKEVVVLGGGLDPHKALIENRQDVIDQYKLIGYRYLLPRYKGERKY